MPTTNVVTSNAAAPIDRLALSIETLRSDAGTGPSIPVPLCACNCFDAGDE